MNDFDADKFRAWLADFGTPNEQMPQDFFKPGSQEFQMAVLTLRVLSRYYSVMVEDIKKHMTARELTIAQVLAGLQNMQTNMD